MIIDRHVTIRSARVFGSVGSLSVLKKHATAMQLVSVLPLIKRVSSILLLLVRLLVLLVLRHLILFPSIVGIPMFPLRVNIGRVMLIISRRLLILTLYVAILCILLLLLLLLKVLTRLLVMAYQLLMRRMWR